LKIGNYRTQADADEGEEKRSALGKRIPAITRGVAPRSEGEEKVERKGGSPLIFACRGEQLVLARLRQGKGGQASRGKRDFYIGGQH